MCGVCCPMDDAEGYDDEEGKECRAIVLSSEAELPVNVLEAPAGDCSCASPFCVSQAHAGLQALPAKPCVCGVGFAVHI